VAEHIARTVMSAATVGTRRGQDERHGERKPARSALARKPSPTAARVSLRTSVFGARTTSTERNTEQRQKVQAAELTLDCSEKPASACCFGGRVL